MVSTLFAEQALLPDGWARNVAIGIDPDGTIASVAAGASAEGAQRLNGRSCRAWSICIPMPSSARWPG